MEERAVDSDALDAEGGGQDLPALVLLTDAFRHRHAHVLERHLVEPRFVQQVDERTHFNARRVHRHDKNRDSRVFGAVRVSARSQPAVFARIRAACVQLPAVDDVIIAFADGAGLKRGEIRAGLGFRVTQTEGDLAPGQSGQVLALLSLAPGGEHDRRDDDARDRVARGAAVQGDLLFDDELLGDRPAAAAVFHRPAQAQPALSRRASVRTRARAYSRAA